MSAEPAAAGRSAAGLATDVAPSWQRPPFALGNDLAATHGAKSARTVAADAQVLLEELRDANPTWLAEVDAASLRAWATAEATCERLRSWIAERGDMDDDGKPRAAGDLLLRWERRAADERGRLGFDPISRGRLSRDTAIAHAVHRGSLTALQNAGRAALGAGQGSRSDDREPDTDGAA